MDEELRKLFREKAAGFRMGRSLPDGVTRSVRRRLIQRLAGLAAVVTVSVTTVALLGQGGPVRVPVPGGGGDRPTIAVRLLAHDEPSDPKAHDPGAGDASEPTSLRRFAACMRQEGFDVPDPVRTGEGWSIQVAPGAEIPSGPAWREAAFVTCRPADFSLSGNLVLGGRTQAEIERFAACLGGEGFDLPAPIRTGDEHVFDLRGVAIDRASDAWSRAVFVTCAPGDVAP